MNYSKHLKDMAHGPDTTQDRCRQPVPASVAGRVDVQGNRKGLKQLTRTVIAAGVRGNRKRREIVIILNKGILNSAPMDVTENGDQIEQGENRIW
ncbi:hypothetical protein Y1Q_0001691 [Alligator mississippiensis]|uniref:Uncharacterized protein n=1 Tax=Alligator mississippiensis TaxID=8496 RepID=A0A151MAH8_ALLMI|nr:hypothetical protein Y1Q_0001691 [Alligator mississippiensis]